MSDTLNSVASQTWTDFEIVAVDDGSTDNTLALLNGWARDNPRIPTKVITQANGYQGKARNAGIRAASGRFVAFLDADDYWYPSKLEASAEALKAHPETDLLSHDVIMICNGEVARRITAGPRKTYRELLLFGNCLSPSATVVAKSKLLEIGGFNETKSYFGVEDYDCWLRLAKASARFQFIPRVLGQYIIHDENVTVASSLVYRKNEVGLLDDHFRDFECHGLFTLLQRGKAISRCRLHYALECIRSGAYTAGALNWAHSMAHAPLYLRTWIWPILMISVVLKRGWRMPGSAGIGPERPR